MMNNKNIFKLILVILPMVISMIVQTIVLNNMAVQGKRLAELENRIEKVKNENSNLEYKNSKLSTLDRITKEADELGMGSVAVSIIDISPDSFVVASK